MKSKFTSDDDQDQDKQNQVYVSLRLRPIRGSHESILVQTGKQVKLTQYPFSTFKFDQIFNEVHNNKQIFKTIVQPSLNKQLDWALNEGRRKDNLIYTYENCNSGNQFTLLGSEKEPGIVQLSVEYLIQMLQDSFKQFYNYDHFSLDLQYYSLYQEQMIDLIDEVHYNKDQPSFCQIKSIEEFYQLLADVEQMKRDEDTLNSLDWDMCHVILEIHLALYFGSNKIKINLGFIGLAHENDIEETNYLISRIRNNKFPQMYGHSLLINSVNHYYDHFVPPLITFIITIDQEKEYLEESLEILVLSQGEDYKINQLQQQLKIKDLQLRQNDKHNQILQEKMHQIKTQVTQIKSQVEQIFEDDSSSISSDDERNMQSSNIAEQQSQYSLSVSQYSQRRFEHSGRQRRIKDMRSKRKSQSKKLKDQQYLQDDLPSFDLNKIDQQIEEQSLVEKISQNPFIIVSLKQDLEKVRQFIFFLIKIQNRWNIDVQSF